MKRIAFLSLAVAVPALLSMPASAQVAGVTAAVNPEASRTPPGQAVRTVILGDNIVQNEKIDTSGAGLVQILLADGTTFTVGPNSSISIDRFVYNPGAGTAEVTATMTRGVFRFIGGRTSKTEGGVKLNTPVGTVGIRGGMVDINLSPSQSGLLAHFDLLFGNEVTLDGQFGGQRIYSAGYSLWVDALGRFNTGKTPAQWRSQIFQNLAGSGGNGGSPNRPTNEQVAGSNVPGSNSSNLPRTTRNIPTPRPPEPQRGQQPDTGLQTYTTGYQGYASAPAGTRPERTPGGVTTAFNADRSSFTGTIGETTYGQGNEPSYYRNDDDFGATDPATQGFMISGRGTGSRLPTTTDLCENCDFLQWGWWGTGSGQQATIEGAWVAGRITSLSDLPRTGSARFSGGAAGTFTDSESTVAATGDMNMNWYFGLKAGTVEVTDFGPIDTDARGKDFSYLVFRSGTDNFGGIGAGIGRNNRSVGLASGSFVADGADDAAGVIGNFSQQGIGWSATGVFAGTRH